MSSSGLARWKLFSPFLFLRLRYEERFTYNAFSILIGLLASLAYSLLPVRPALMGSNGVLNDILGFTSILFPFFVAALVAVATFQREGMDRMPNGGQVQLKRRNDSIVSLTRRQFVCFIFGYCSALSATIFISIIITKSLFPWISVYFSGDMEYIKLVYIFIISSSFAHMITITFWGMYYLTDRISN